MINVYLRAFEPEDYRITVSWRKDPEVVNSLGGNHYFVSENRERSWIEQKSLGDNSELYMAICLSDDHKLIGYTSINNIDLRNLRAEWGGTIIGDKNYWGKGIATKAASMMLDYLFAQYPIHKCYGYCLAEHSVTIKMLNSLGFSKDGILRDHVYKNGEFKSLLLFSVLRDEYLREPHKVQ
jgi:RimJ/RimL family protein N-acetyltransferase